MLETFCTNLHGVVGGAVRIECIEIEGNEIIENGSNKIKTNESNQKKLPVSGNFNMIIKIPFDKRTIILQSLAVADVWKTERISIVILQSSPFLFYL